MSATTRIYLLSLAGRKRLVRAANATRAVAHVTADSIRVVVPSQDELLAARDEGVEVETAGEAPQAEAPQGEGAAP